MSVADLLNVLKERGVELWFEGERLRYRAPKGALTDEQRAELSLRRAEILAQLRADAAGQEKTFPLSFSQRSMWFVHQQAPESWAYHVVTAARIESDVNVTAMRQALQSLVDRHAVLRTSYDFVDGALSQRVAGIGTATFDIHAVPGLTDDELRVLVERDYRRPFDLRSGQVFRASLYTSARADHVLLLNVHHIAIDAWSLLLLIDELLKLYVEATGGAPAALPRPELQYTDYASWQERTLAGPEGDRLWSYWREKLAPPRQLLDLATNFPRPAVQTFRGATLPIQFDVGLTQKIKDLARYEGTTAFVVLLASFQVFLFRHSGVEDVIVGTPTFARSKAEFMRVVGDFVNSVPLRGRLSAIMTFRDLVAQLRQTVIEALDAQEFPLPLLVQRLQPERGSGHSPLFNTFFSLLRFEQAKNLEAIAAGDGCGDAVEFGSLQLRAYPINQQEGQFDLAVRLGERGDAFCGAFAYSTDLFEETTVQAYVADYLALVKSLVEEPAAPLGDFSKTVPSGDNDVFVFIEELRNRDIRILLDGEQMRVNAPKGSLDDGLKKTIAARRNEIVAALKSAAVPAEKKCGAEVIRQISRNGSLPVSSAQQRFWFMEQMQPGRSEYNTGGPVRYHGLLDIETMRQAVNDLVIRHESFRICISESNGSPRVEFLEASKVPLEVVDLSQTSEESREGVALGLADALLRSPFNLARGPLARFLLLRLAPDDHIFVVSMHHAAADAWSLMNIASRDLCELYDARATGRVANLPRLPIQYVDYAAWEREQMISGGFAEHVAYWKRQLQDAPALLELPTDRPRPAAQSFRGGSVRRYFNGHLIDILKTLARDHQATLFMVLLAAWQVLLHRYTAQDDIVVGSPVTSRGRPAFEGIIGTFVNNLVLRSRLGGNPTFADFLAQVKENVLSAFDHSALPFDMLVEALNPPRSTSHSPIFQVLFSFISLETVAPGKLSAEIVEWDKHTSRFDLSLDLGFVEIGEHKGELCAIYEYAADLFDEPTIVRLHAHFEQVMAAVAANPLITVREVPLLASEKEQQLLNSWNATALGHDRTACLHTLLEAAAETTPNAPAVTAAGVTFSYRELDRRANQLAHLLVQRGVRPGDLVAICLNRTVDMPVALAGVLKAGAAYVPLDPTHPAERLHYTLEDAGVSATITLSRFVSLLGTAKSQILVLDDARTPLATQPDSKPGVVVRPDNLAYVIYTSGSTGRPKGVQVEHRNVVSFLESMRREPGMTATDVLLAVTTLSFDIAGLEIWLPLTVGARVVIASNTDVLDGERLISLLETHGVTIMQATPATWHLMLESGWIGGGNLKALCGGETMRRELAEALLGRVGELWNMYGPTETTIWSTNIRILEPSNSIPIGHPIANTRIYILDAAQRLAPIGITGELCIGGEGVSRGYLNRPQLTADRFVVIMLPDGSSERVYRTGDIARLRWDGQLEFYGRRDQQVKLRGYRIELGEIEAILGTYPGVKECVVIAREETPDDHRLFAYVTLSEGASFDSEDVRAALRVKLPEYMIPNMFSVLPALPLTLNGKIDRNALPVPDRSPIREDSETEALMTPMQRRVATIWQGLLRRERVGLHDNFFDLGGHSLLLAKLNAELKREFGGDLSLVELFQKTTVAAQADRLSSANSDNALERARARAIRQLHG